LFDKEVKQFDKVVNISDVIKQIDNTEYLLIDEINQHEIYLDSNNHTIKIIWNETIDQDSLSKVLMLSCRKILNKKAFKLLLEFKKTKSFEITGLNWLRQEFLPSKKVKTTFNLIEKIALVRQNHLINDIISEINHPIDGRVFPNLKIYKFSDYYESEAWLKCESKR